MEERLPEGWVWTTLGEISTRPQYGWTTKAKPTEGTVLLLRTTDISSGTVDWNSVPYCTAVPEHLADYLLEAGDIVISRAGSVGISYLLRDTPKQAVFASYLIRFHPLEGSEPYVAYYLQTSEYWNRIYEEISGIALANVNARKLETVELPLAPLPEQNRIVAVIEQQFTRLDAAVASLRSAQAKLKQYRASLLKAAVEGELTKQWRDEHPAGETGVQLLTRILAERRARWEEEQLAKMREKGMTPKDDKWKQEYKEPQGPDVEQLPELPEGWCYTFLKPLLATSRKGMMTGPFGSLLKKQEHCDDGIPVFGIENIAAMRFVAGSKIHITEDKALELSQYDALPGDILISRSGTVGEVCVVPENLGEARISTNLMRVSLVEGEMVPQFFCILFNGSPFVLNQVSELCKGSTRDFLSQAILSQIIFPLPPLAEQAQIVAEVEAQLSRSARLEETIEADLKRAEQERQSILREAFAGRLVAQEPGDEPASVLLERIREERKQREEAEKMIKSSRKGTPMEMAKRRRASRARAGQPGVGLYETLVAAGEPLPPDDLFRRAGLKADEQPESNEVFYEELEADVEDKLIEVIRLDQEVRETRPKYDVLLTALEPSDELLERLEEDELQEEEQGEQIARTLTLWDMK